MNDLFVAERTAGALSDVKDEALSLVLKKLIYGSKTLDKRTWYLKKTAEKPLIEKTLDKLLSDRKKLAQEQINKAYAPLEKSEGGELAKPDIDNHFSIIKQSSVNAYMLIAASVMSAKERDVYTGVVKQLPNIDRYSSVTYSNGRKVSYDSYAETTSRETIHQSLNELDLKSDSKLYWCNEFPDPAKDHAKYQGNIYVKAAYKSEYPQYLTVEEVVAPPIRLTTRWNCRHRLEPIKDEKDHPKRIYLSAKVMKKNNDALNKQRLLEREIRKAKLETQVHSLIYEDNNDEKELSLMNISRNKANVYQSKMKTLIESNDFLKRNTDRETEEYELGINKHNLSEETIKAIQTPSLKSRVYDYNFKITELNGNANDKKMTPEKQMELLKDVQEGEANENNFFYETMANFKEVEKPDRNPDHISYKSIGGASSKYWYTEEGVYRESDHWGSGVAGCDWFIDTKEKKSETTITGLGIYKKPIVGFAKWKDFLQKTGTIRFLDEDEKETEEEGVPSTFKNTVGRGLFKIKDKYYKIDYSQRSDEFYKMAKEKYGKWSASTPVLDFMVMEIPKEEVQN